MTSAPDLVIYHGPTCLDGFTAAWAVWRRFRLAEYLPANYGDAPPDVKGRNVLIVDFSYKQHVLQEMIGAGAHSITVLDHHKTAAADLMPYQRSPLFPFEDLMESGAKGGFMPIQAHFDMNKSGARLAWEWAFPGEHVPNLVKHVEDRDLWRFALPDTEEVCAALSSRDFDFAEWTELADAMDFPTSYLPILAEGKALLRQRRKDAKAVVAANAGAAWQIAGHFVPVANCPYWLASDVGNILAEDAPFAATYHDTNDGKRSFSLRSSPTGVDVQAIAKLFGGGGHVHAAGFSVDRPGDGRLDAPPPYGKG